ncbi:probable cytochrome P450 6a14 isoform X1 [Copidosoma floridanum]|uniref:probable cytochrome P450 6a14 isoform X1 n=1 Tax=Copidosoma floridanum TaxID=29053 RepID=UPI000C6F70E9|nr:probable cytochrome P450 6a14 isoform X1 [Copidosoma floridanum]
MLQAMEQMFHTKLFWITVIILGFYTYLKFVVYNYWNKKGIPHDAPSIPFGNTVPVVTGKLSVGNLLKESYEKFKKLPFHGVYIFYKPMLVINDPELIRQILIKDFNKFRDRGLYFNEKIDPLSGHLFFLPGEKWRRLRAKLSPIFTSGKLKQMFPLLKEIGDDLVKVCDKTIDKDDVIELKSMIGRYTADTISSTAFGFNCKSLDNPENEFKRHLLMVFDQSPLKNALAFVPIVLDVLRIPFTPYEVIRFFSKLFEDMVNQRQQSNVVRKDFVNLLMQLMDKGILEEDDKSTQNGSSKDSNNEKLSLVQAQAQAFVFFVAGYETTSSTITYCLYELAMNPDIQEKVHEEIDEVCSKPGGITYERVMNEFEYLHMVFCETLRKHPSLAFLNRVCIEDYNIPNSNVTLEKGTGVIVPVSGLQRDPNFFPDPDKFDPMRFSKDNIAARNPYVYLPFGDGPRVCIGTRFGHLQSKIALISVLHNFKFSACPKTSEIVYSKRALVQAPEGGVYVRMERRKK